MSTLFKNGRVINVFTGSIEKKNVLIDGDTIIGVGDYDEADEIIDISSKYICPSFIDGHIHVESTMMLPHNLAKHLVLHGTGAIVNDPHEIANACGIDGIKFMMEDSKNLPMKFYFTLPSCVPATPFDENGASLCASDYEDMYTDDVVALGEMMNYPGVIYNDQKVWDLIRQARAKGKIVNGHAPLVLGNDLDRYLTAGVTDDHECTRYDEAVEKLEKGQWILIRQGKSARNLKDLQNLFDEPYCHRCLLSTDDKDVFDIMENGHIDMIIAKSVRHGKSVVAGIQMATINAALHYGLNGIGAIAPGYKANLLILNELHTVEVNDVYYLGKCVCKDKKVFDYEIPKIPENLVKAVSSCMNLKRLTKSDFLVQAKTGRCRIITMMKNNLITGEKIMKMDFMNGNGIDVERDILKLAVCERYKNTGHIGIGFINGMQLKKGAIASTVAHDSHNMIIVGASEEDMAVAGNALRELGGGFCIACDGKVLATLALPIAGLMTDAGAETIMEEVSKLNDVKVQLGLKGDMEPIISLAFLSLPVIPKLKLTTLGLVDVEEFKQVPLFV